MRLVEVDKELISETELLESIKTGRKEYGAGKTIKANSLAVVVRNYHPRY